MSEQSKVIDLANYLESVSVKGSYSHDAAAELRRLDAENAALRDDVLAAKGDAEVLRKERDALRAQLPTGSNYVIISKPALSLALNALQRDAEEGKLIRGEIADEIKKSCREYDAPQKTPVDEREAFRDFEKWLSSQMPANTVIGDPLWWADRIWSKSRAALKPAVPSKLAANANPLNMSNIEARVAYVMGWNGCIDSMLSAAKDGEA